MTSYRQARREQTASSLWLPLVVLGIAVTVFGLLLITRPFDTATALAAFAGIALVLSGLSEVVSAAHSPRASRECCSGCYSSPVG